jgi:hypothetical protein
MPVRRRNPVVVVGPAPAGHQRPHLKRQTATIAIVRQAPDLLVWSAYQRPQHLQVDVGIEPSHLPTTEPELHFAGRPRGVKSGSKRLT